MPESLLDPGLICVIIGFALLVIFGTLGAILEPSHAPKRDPLWDDNYDPNTDENVLNRPGRPVVGQALALCERT